jgi:Flp pilus assembly protein TadG
MRAANSRSTLQQDRGPGPQRPRGQALVETALVLPLLLLLLIGTIDFGRGIYLYITVSNAAREGARVAIVNQSPAAAAGRAAQQGTGLGLSSTPTTCLSGSSGVCVSFPSRTDATSPTKSTTDAKVTVWYQFTPITPIIGNVIGTITVSSSTQLPIERVCTSGC